MRIMNFRSSIGIGINFIVYIKNTDILPKRVARWGYDISETQNNPDNYVIKGASTFYMSSPGISSTKEEFIEILVKYGFLQK